MRERILRVMLVGSVVISVFTMVSFIQFLDQLPAIQSTTTYQLSMRQIDFGNGSFIMNRSLSWMYFLLGYNVLTLGLAVLFFKPKEQKLIELGLYNIVLSGLFFAGLFLYVSMFPEVVSSAVQHKFLYSVFYVDGESFNAVNILFLLTLVYAVLNGVLASIKKEK